MDLGGGATLPWMWVARGDLCWWCCGFCGFGGVCVGGDLGFSENDSVSFSTLSLR